MLFNSIEFAFFLPLVFAAYWLIGSSRMRGQNILILAASYVFYGWWDWRFLFLIIGSSLADFLIAIQLDKAKRPHKKYFLWLSLLLNLSLLGTFKYYDFFVQSFVEGFNFFGAQFSAERLNLILPVGISFYTFQTLSYTIDVYRKELKPTRDFVSFFGFVSFFPQLVAGPIERAKNLLPQFQKQRQFKYGLAVDGLRQILWGMFKKVVIADNCALFVSEAFADSSAYTGSTLAAALLLFSIQVYADFSGYSDIAIGTAKLFGFKLMQNFSFPYFSRNIAEFWQRWHISLTTWIRDYIYIPLGGNRGTKANQIRNVFIIFVACGFWHGANWTYIYWGALNAIYFLPGLLRKNKIRYVGVVAEGSVFPSPKMALYVLKTFLLIAFSLVFFRAPSLSEAWQYYHNMLQWSFFSMPKLTASELAPELSINILLGLLALFFLVEWMGRTGKHALQVFAISWPKMLRFGFYILVAFATFLFSGNHQSFVYFQF